MLHELIEKHMSEGNDFKNRLYIIEKTHGKVNNKQDFVNVETERIISPNYLLSSKVTGELA